ncbi:hypothetical protein [Leuconostoc lactis]|uniref:hypothetical protein n=1 Tax=Leuconostoc lactis TaxID=1246 RepID=UPI0006DCA7A7|nr:hypothetical protein [Leuconostoc lactis]KQB82462.1 hypothetical protein AN225_03105 [Leuconostoc lactis]
MTFDEAIAKVGTYLKNNDLSNADNNDRFFYIILNDLREEYAPTVEMTKKQYDTLKWYKDNLDFAACLGTFQNYNGETRMGNKFDDLKGELSDEDIMQSWLHPETIKVVDE